MNFRIVEEDTTPSSRRTTQKIYKVSLILSDDEKTITLNRIYYNRGYEVDELDQFYCTVNHNDQKWTIKSLSYLTLRFNDKKYLEEQEKLLFEKFYEYLLVSEKNLKTLADEVNKRILVYQEIQKLNEFRAFQRREKLKKIDKEVN